MGKYSVLLVGALLGLAAVNSAATQAASAKLEVVISRYEGEKKTGTQPFYFALAVNTRGSLRVEQEAAPVRCPVPAVETPVSTQVDAFVTPSPDGRFTVELTIADRAFAGCRNVGTLQVPVFSNRILAKVVRLAEGETIETSLHEDKARNAVTKAVVTLKK